MAEDLAKVRPLLRREAAKQAPKIMSPPAAGLSITTTPPTVVRTKRHKKHKKHENQQGTRLNEAAAHLFPNGYPLLEALSNPDLHQLICNEYDRRKWKPHPSLSAVKRHRRELRISKCRVRI
jgi:hypothetical protein